MESLKQKTKSGLLWSSIERFSNQGVQFIFSIILARILLPSDYGIIAMLSIFFAVAQTFIDSGFSNALIRKPDRTEKDNSTAFYFNVIIGLVSYTVLFLIAPIVADFYKQPILSPILRVSALSVVFNSLCIVQQALLTIEVDFKSQAKITLTSSVITGVLGVFLAYKGYGVWALVFQGVASQFLRMILFWIITKWKPYEKFSKESFSYLFGYGSKLLASGLLETIYSNLYPIIIGKFFMPAQLGLFSRAQGLATLPSSNITGILQRVTFPILSLIQEDDERLRENYRKFLRMSAYIVFPLMMLFLSIASPLVRILLTSKWDDCVIYLQILCFAMMWHPIHAINLNLLQVKGRSDLFLRLEIIKKIIGVLIMIIAIPFGVKAMCYGLAGSSLISLCINIYYTGQLINLGYTKQFKDLFPILVNSLILAAIVYFSLSLLQSDWSKLIAGILIGCIYYIGISIVFKPQEWTEIKSLVRKKNENT